jgi:DNA polymerase-3 subunit alpha
LNEEQIVILEAEVQKTDNTVKLLGEKIVPIDQAGKEWTSGIIIKVDPDQYDSDTLEQLKPIIERYPGDCISCVKIHVNDDNPSVLVKLSDEYCSCSDPSFFKEVENLLGEGTIETQCAPIKAKVKKKRPWETKNNGK